MDVTDTRDPTLFSIGEAARRSDVNIETIRYYERIGLLPTPHRSAGGHRLFDTAMLKRLCFVRRARRLGFSLEEIGTLLSMVDREDYTCAEVHRLTIEHLAEVRRKLADLGELEKALSAMAADCDRGDVPDCAIVDVLFADDDRLPGAIATR